MSATPWHDGPKSLDPTLRVSMLEHRADRPYDEQDPSHLLLPNGTSADFTDRALGNAMARATLASWEAAA